HRRGPGCRASRRSVEASAGRAHPVDFAPPRHPRAPAAPMSPPDLLANLDSCLRRDQFRLRRERDRLRAQRQRGRDVTAAEAALAEKIAASVAARQARAASVPAIEYPAELPVSAHREEIRRAIEAHPVVIVCGETGSGKTTQLPK